MFQVFITRKIPEVGIKLLKQKKYRVKINPFDRILKKAEIIKMAASSDALFCLLTDKIDGQVMAGIGSQLKIIANLAVGFDNIDLRAAKKRGIMVTNTPGVLTEAVAEHTIALIFAIIRRIVEADKFIRAGKFRGWEPMLFLGADLKGKKLGLIGFGRIGSEIAKRMHDGFNMKIVYYDIKRNYETEKRYGLKYLDLETLLKTADFVSLHVGLSPQTRHLIDFKELKMMKRSAYLINTSRGPIVNEKALVKALRDKWIKGAALDVFEFEPKLTSGLAKLANVVLTPHIASATEETRDEMAEMAAKNIIAGLSGKIPVNLIKM
ncbi:D-glycerate dehydrogenase [Candidatus Wolfebacteria bacterium]|nr:D-glycerate dehydrogenase [Candidatus Wolfebacteria bacterium]